LRSLGPSASRLCRAEDPTEAEASGLITGEINEVNTEYLIVFSVAAMMTLYVLIIARCLGHA
jgi:hypothetical protein